MCCIYSMPLMFMSTPLLFLMMLPLVQNVIECLPLILLIITVVKIIQFHTHPEEKKHFQEMKNRLCEKFNKNEFHCPFASSIHGINETHNAFYIDIELPGVKKEDINVDFEGNVITVSCPRYKRDYSEEEKMVKVCDYKKAFRLPESANMDSTMAKYENGILSLFIEKKPEFAEQKKNIVVE